MYALTEFHVTPRGDAYAYSYLRVLSQLYVASGLSESRPRLNAIGRVPEQPSRILFRLCS